MRRSAAHEPGEDAKFDAIAAHPAFSLRWDPSDAVREDIRFKSHSVAPKSAAAFAFLLCGLQFLKDAGTMAIRRWMTEERALPTFSWNLFARDNQLQLLPFYDGACPRMSGCVAN